MARQKTLAETRAERSASREMAAIVEYSGDAISAPIRGTITSWNRAAEHLFGYTSEEAVGLLGARLAPPERQEEAERNRRFSMKAAMSILIRPSVFEKMGRVCRFLLSVSSLRDARGRIVGRSAIARDMSAEKQSEEAIRRSEKLATAGRLAASIAHEINNPLEAVVNLLYLAREDSANAAQYLTMAEQEVGRVARLAQQTLGFVRDTNSPGAVNTGAIMEEILQLYSRKIEARQIRVDRRFREVGENQRLCRRDAAVLRQPGGECDRRNEQSTGSSVRARSAGSRLAQRTRRRSRDGGGQWQRHRSSRPAAHLRAFLYDKKDTGTGLGLWVSGRIVRKHGGSIRLRSRAEAGHGTVFSVFLPYHGEVRQAA